jgi:hypothetical protein
VVYVHLFLLKAILLQIAKRKLKTQSQIAEQIAEQIAKRNRKVNHERIRENAWVKNFGYQRDPLQNCFLLSIL